MRDFALERFYIYFSPYMYMHCMIMFAWIKFKCNTIHSSLLKIICV